MQKEAEYYNVDRVEGTRKQRGGYKNEEITRKVYQCTLNLVEKNRKRLKKRAENN